MKKLIFLFSVLLTFLVSAQSNSNYKQDRADILAVMKAQEVAWSNNNLEEFMQGYWKSDSLNFMVPADLLKVGNKL